MHHGLGEGMLVEGAADPSLEQLRVVDQERNPIP
jgi:hypothetical protein